MMMTMYKNRHDTEMHRILRTERLMYDDDGDDENGDDDAGEKTRHRDSSIKWSKFPLERFLFYSTATGLQVRLFLAVREPHSKNRTNGNPAKRGK